MMTFPSSSQAALAFDIGCTFVLFPCLLLLAARSRSVWPPGARFLGNLSYPLYATHMPLILLAGGLTTRLGGIVPSPAFASLVGLAALSFAVLAGTFFDLPARAFLKSALGKFFIRPGAAKRQAR